MDIEKDVIKPEENTKQISTTPIDWSEGNKETVQVIDINISFWRWICILVKVAFAVIPAVIIFTTILTAIIIIMPDIMKSLIQLIAEIANTFK